MSENKRRKMDLGAACSSVGAGEPHIAQPTPKANCNENKKKTIFNPSVAEFREAVKWPGFVDRSLLIEELLLENPSTNVMIFAPRRFGKSMNLSMVKCFLEIEKGRDVTKAPQDLKELENFENFKAFSRYQNEEELKCKILKKEVLVKEHFGRHPVLYLSFKDVKASSIEEVEYDVKAIVHYAYQAHSYLESREIFSDSKDNERAKKTCTIWCDPIEYKKEKAIEGVKLLIKYLHACHKSKVYLLVDEFDAPTVDALLASKSGKEVRQISREITKLLGAVVKGNFQKYLLGSLITGVSYLASAGISDDMNSVPIYKWLLDHKGRFAPYYGLSEDELKTLIQQVFPKEDQEERNSIQEEVKKLYNGYNINNKSLYCLWSVLHYIEERSNSKPSNIENKFIWGGSSIIRKMGSLLRNSRFTNDMVQIMDLAEDRYISFSPCEKVDVQELADLLSEAKSISYDTILSFFMEQGYLTHVQGKSVPRRDTRESHDVVEVYVKIPNVDVFIGFKEMFKDFCVNTCELDERIMDKCAAIFQDLSQEKDVEIIKEKLRDFHNHLQLLLQAFDGIEGVHERSLQAVLYVTFLKGRFKECCMEKYVKIGEKKFGRIDQWLHHDNFSCIIEEKFVKSGSDDSCKKTARQALDQILPDDNTKKVSYTEILDLEEYEKNTYLLMGICMSDRGKPYMCCLVNSKNPKDCITFPEDH